MGNDLTSKNAVLNLYKSYLSSTSWKPIKTVILVGKRRKQEQLATFIAAPQLHSEHQRAVHMQKWWFM